MRRHLAPVILITLLPAAAGAQEIGLNEVHKLSGPRVGFGFVAGIPRTELEDRYGVRPLVTEFGWQFEQLVLPRPGAVNFVVEEVVLLGGLDQGSVLPSVRASVGIRHPAGLAVGVGPSLSPYGLGVGFSVGVNLRYGTVTLPLSLSAVRNGDATRVTLLGGFAIETARRVGAEVSRH